MTRPFDIAYAHVLEVEGGYSDHASDRGGATRFGVTEVVARAHGYRGPMAELPLDKAREIYKASYWDILRLDDIAVLSYPVAAEVFDTGVNMGIARAGKFLQRALNALNRGATIYSDLVVDGVVGPVTVGAFRAYLDRRGKQGEMVLLRALNGLQVCAYVELAEGDPRQEDFVFGWLKNRVVI